jgi:hypothetical protein
MAKLKLTRTEQKVNIQGKLRTVYMCNSIKYVKVKGRSVRLSSLKKKK